MNIDYYEPDLEPQTVTLCIEEFYQRVKGLVECFYETGDVDEMEYELIKLARLAGVKTPCNFAKVQKKPKEMSALFKLFADVARTQIN